MQMNSFLASYSGPMSCTLRCSRAFFIGDATAFRSESVAVMIVFEAEFMDTRWSWWRVCLAAASLYFVYQQTTGAVWASGIAGIVLLLLWVGLDLGRAQLPGQKESAKQGLTATLIVLVGFALVVVLQALVVRYDGRVDLTGEGRYTLSDHSISVLENLDTPVTVYAIFRKGVPDQETFTRLVRGASAVTDKIQLVEVDPLFDVSLLRQVVQNENERERGRLGEYGAVVLTTDTQRQRIDGNYSETAFVNALIRLDSEKRIDVCWSVGHGERDFDSQTDPSAMGILAQRMRDQNYEIRPIRVLGEGIPKTVCVVCCGRAANRLAGIRTGCTCRVYCFWWSGIGVGRPVDARY